jgi:hypothetical protein
MRCRTPIPRSVSAESLKTLLASWARTPGSALRLIGRPLSLQPIREDPIRLSRISAPPPSPVRTGDALRCASACTSLLSGTARGNERVTRTREGMPSRTDDRRRPCGSVGPGRLSLDKCWVQSELCASVTETKPEDRETTEPSLRTHGSRSDRAHERRVAIDKRGPDKC